MNLDSISQELDRLYEFEIREYVARCNELKQSGYKIYRNSAGKHKVVQGGQPVRKEEVQYSYDKRNEPEKEGLPTRVGKAVKKRIDKFKRFVKTVKFLYDNSKDRYN